jgi:hypothetical protein
MDIPEDQCRRRAAGHWFDPFLVTRDEKGYQKQGGQEDGKKQEGGKKEQGEVLHARTLS